MKLIQYKRLRDIRKKKSVTNYFLKKQDVKRTSRYFGISTSRVYQILSETLRDPDGEEDKQYLSELEKL